MGFGLKPELFQATIIQIWFIQNYWNFKLRDKLKAVQFDIFHEI